MTAPPTATTAPTAPTAPSVSPGTPNALLLVLTRELRTRARSGGFILSSLLTVVLLVGVIVVPTLLSGPTTYEVGVVGDGNQPIIADAERLANQGADPDEPTSFNLTTYPDEAAARRAVRAGDVAAALVGGSDLLVERASGFGGGNDLVELLQRAAGAREVEGLVGATDAERVREALEGDVLAVTPLSGQDAADSEGRSILAYGGLLLTYMLILQYGMWTLSGVTEEKSNRVMELLLAAARPWQLFAGKVAGTALLGLAQFAITLAAALIAIRVTDAFTLPSIPSDFIGVLVLWVLLGYATYLVLYGAAGALADKPEDAQTTTTPITLVVLTGFFASFAVLNDPSGLLATIATFFPLWAPFAVPIRAALGALPLWQAVASVLLSLGAIVAMTALSARVYRGGSLHTGGRLGWLQALRDART